MSHDDPKFYVESPCAHSGATPACPCGQYLKAEYSPPKEGPKPLAAFGFGLMAASVFHLVIVPTPGSAFFLGAQGLILVLAGFFWNRI